eukprot:TRINITY_DN6062_c0_g1_i1.p1 TRINITY_DN6062_c0_g1~~TRINITY_DN6062_c0_g1_i1.p1  ORF type:complete len:318 (-),score=61.03 TRINITY_DN6062_c0_g1_i1:15-968(-)
MGLYKSAGKYVGWPICPGFEFSGTVIAFGEDHDDPEYENEFRKKGIKVGDLVLGVTRFGAYSTHVIAPKHQLFPLPSKLSLDEAAAFPAVWLTAYYAMHELAHVRKNDTILVHSAAGGVGGALVQLGKVAGCRVVAVVGSSHKVGFVKKFGADHVIDKSKENLWAKCEEYVPEGFDVVFDANGVETLKQSYKHLSEGGGKLVIYGFHTMLPKTGGVPSWLSLAWNWLWTPSFNPLNMTSDNVSVLAFNLSFLFHKTELFARAIGDLLRMVENGQITSPKITTYPLEEVVQAHKDIESGQTVGKLVLRTDHLKVLADE